MSNLRDYSADLQRQLDNLDRHIEHAETDLKRMKAAREKLVGEKADIDEQIARLPQPKPEKAPKA
jgi:chromosome segregation ATPase